MFPYILDGIYISRWTVQRPVRSCDVTEKWLINKCRAIIWVYYDSFCWHYCDAAIRYVLYNNVRSVTMPLAMTFCTVCYISTEAEMMTACLVPQWEIIHQLSQHRVLSATHIFSSAALMLRPPNVCQYPQLFQTEGAFGTTICVHRYLSPPFSEQTISETAPASCCWFETKGASKVLRSIYVMMDSNWERCCQKPVSL